MHLLAVQPRIRIEDYASSHAFERKLDSLEPVVAAARARAVGGDGTALVVFPEMLGTFLMLAGEPVEGVSTVDAAIRRSAIRHIRDVLGAMARRRVTSVQSIVLALMARKARRLYVDAFRRCARRLGAHVVAGSALLPDVAFDAPTGALPATTRVFNTSYHFAPDGSIVSGTRKVNLVPVLETALGLGRGAPARIAMDAIDGKQIATLICYDGFREPHTHSEPDWTNVAAQVDAQGADVIANPAANPWPWDAPWVHNDPGESLLRREQWAREGIGGQLGTFGHARWSATAQLVGTVLDTHFEGISEVLERADDGTVRVLARAQAKDVEEVLCVRIS